MISSLIYIYSPPFSPQLCWAGGQGVKGAGIERAGVEGSGSGGRGGGDNINYLVKIITENKVFHFLRNWMLLSASDVCQITVFDFYFPWFGNFFSCLSLSPSLSLV